MKKKILLTTSAMFILALGIVAFAFNQSNNLSKTISPDTCAMKKTTAHAGESQAKTSCCDKEDCCCKNGGSCPMKMHDESVAADSCPMKNKDVQATGVEMKNVTVVSGESCCEKGANCCNGGAFCKGKHS